MKPVCALVLSLLVAGCTYAVRPEQPPGDPLERRRAEVAACSHGALPAWLDDTALGAAIRTDQREAQASTTNESFHGAAYTSQPPASRALTSSRASALLDERRTFEQWCAGVRAGPKGFVKP